MPNIYLRLPTSRCQFFRHRDPKHTLAADEPVVFSPYTSEYFVIRNSLSNASAITQTVNFQCFSQQQWRNMLSGRHSLGGRVVLKRSMEEPLTYTEVELLNGKTEHNRSTNEDYLCIKTPSEVEVVDTVRPVTPTWNLTLSGVRQLVVLLNNDFKRSVVEWALSTFDYCTSNGRIVCRGHAAMLERYLMRYGIEPSWEEKDNLRRVIDRWLCMEHNYFKAYSCLTMQYEDQNERQYAIDSIKWD